MVELTGNLFLVSLHHGIDRKSTKCLREAGLCETPTQPSPAQPSLPECLWSKGGKPQLFWSRGGGGWKPVPLRGGPMRCSPRPNTSERPMARKNGACQQLCIDGGWAALGRGLRSPPMRPEPGRIREAPGCVVPGPASALRAPCLRASTHCLMGICPKKSPHLL